MWDLAQATSTWDAKENETARTLARSGFELDPQWANMLKPVPAEATGCLDRLTLLRHVL